MRHLIDLIESFQTVYHGSSGPLETVHYYPFFVSPDIAVARGYAKDRRGQLYAFRFHPTQIAEAADVHEIASSLGLDDDRIATHELLSPNINDDAIAIIAGLREQGFDCVAFSDFAMDDDFKEVDAIAVLCDGVLSPPSLVESKEFLSVKPHYGQSKQIEILKNPSRGEMISLARNEQGAQLRGMVFRDHWVVWRAQDAIHMIVASAYGREDEFIDDDTPTENSFYVRVENPQDIIFIGNPDYGARYIPNFIRVFDHIDMIGDDEETAPPYEPTEWGLPGRYGGWSSVIG